VRDEEDEDEKIFQQFKRNACVASPAKRKRQREAFVKVPLWWAQAAAKATRTPKGLVWVELLHVAWKAKSLTFSLPAGQLEKKGVPRETRRRALRELEAAGLIKVAWLHGKTPHVSIVLL
jgi:hypothetical protein